MPKPFIIFICSNEPPGTLPAILIIYYKSLEVVEEVRFEPTLAHAPGVKITVVLNKLPQNKCHVNKYTRVDGLEKYHVNKYPRMECVSIHI